MTGQREAKPRPIEVCASEYRFCQGKGRGGRGSLVKPLVQRLTVVAAM
jgi:hypothetical protein